MLIFDEVISGFRVGFEGAAGYYAIQPDIVTYGKIIGGGMPVGAFGASNEIMSMISPDGPVYQAGTLSANPVAMAAGIASIVLLLQDGFYEVLEQKTESFCSKIEEHIESNAYPMRIERIASIFWLNFSDNRVFSADQIDASKMELFKKLHAGLLDNGVYLGPSGYEVGFVSAAHSDELLEEAATKICKEIDKLFN